ncbi:MAG TPA: hypothetical protein VIX42_06500 [Edaphobacter sp.]
MMKGESYPSALMPKRNLLCSPTVEAVFEKQISNYNDNDYTENNSDYRAEGNGDDESRNDDCAQDNSGEDFFKP